MRAFHLLKISITLPGLPEPDEGWHPAFTQDLAATGAYHEVTCEGLLVRLPAGAADEGPAEGAPAAVPYTGNLRFDLVVPGGAQGTLAARLEEGRVLWAERLDHERFEGRARLYYRGGRPIAMTDAEYRERRRADHDEALTEEHIVSAVCPHVASDGRGVGVETRGGARFEVVPEGELALPKPGDQVRLYLVAGRTDGAHDEIVGVDLNGEPVYYDPPEEHARRSFRRRVAAVEALDARVLQAWFDLRWQLIGYPGGSAAYGVAESEGALAFPNVAEAERRAVRMHEVHEEAHRRAHQESMSRFERHAHNLSHPNPCPAPATGLLSDAATGEGEGRPVCPWTGRPLGEGVPEGR